MGAGKSGLNKKHIKVERAGHSSLLESSQFKSQEVVDKLRFFRTDKNEDNIVRVEKEEFVLACLPRKATW